MLLNDGEIAALVRGQPPLAHPVDTINDSARSQVQASSLDLRIGGIYLPERKGDEPGGKDHPRADHSLPPGHTVVVETKETLTFPDDVGGVAFPPDAISKRGLLVTNPGHVDPGFRGRMKFTVINMGREAFPLASGGPIVTLLLFRLQQPADTDWFTRVGAPGQGVTQDILDVLSADFLSVERRAEEIAETIANRKVETARFWTVALSALSTVALILLTILPVYLAFLGVHSSTREEIIRLRTEQDALLERNDPLEQEIESLREIITGLQLRRG